MQSIHTTQRSVTSAALQNVQVIMTAPPPTVTTNVSTTSVTMASPSASGGATAGSSASLNPTVTPTKPPSPDSPMETSPSQDDYGSLNLPKTTWKKPIIRPARFTVPVSAHQSAVTFTQQHQHQL